MRMNSSVISIVPEQQQGEGNQMLLCNLCLSVGRSISSHTQEAFTEIQHQQPLVAPSDLGNLGDLLLLLLDQRNRNS